MLFRTFFSFLSFFRLLMLVLVLGLGEVWWVGEGGELGQTRAKPVGCNSFIYSASLMQ
jgi:hypothetical protein